MRGHLRHDPGTERSEPLMVTLPAPGAPDWVDDCSAPLTMMETTAFVARACGLGSSTFTMRPSASLQTSRFLSASSVTIVQSTAVSPSPDPWLYCTLLMLPSCFEVCVTRFRGSYTVVVTPKVGSAWWLLP